MKHLGYRYSCGDHDHEYSLTITPSLPPTDERAVYEVRYVPDAAPDGWAAGVVIVTDGPAPWIQSTRMRGDTTGHSELFGDTYDRYAGALQRAQKWAIALIDMLDRQARNSRL